MTTLTFPQGFRFGAATAAAQIEGAGSQGGKADSIWDVFCREPGTIADGSDIQVACDHYNLMPQDVALMKELGLSTYRFSVSWARVMPDGRTLNPEGLDFYKRLVDELLANGITPWLTLYHWDLPAALGAQGGWTSRSTAEAFVPFALAVYERLADKVPTWTTLNEPWCSSLLSYAGGEHAPGHTDPVEAVAAVHHLLLAHGWATTALRQCAAELGHSPTLGITLNFAAPHPADPSNPGDVDMARRIDGSANRLFLDPIFRGSYPADVVEDLRGPDSQADIMAFVEPGDLQAINVPIDVLGVNYYTGIAVAAADPQDRSEVTYRNENGRLRRSPNVGAERARVVSRGVQRTHMGWEVSPDDLRALLVRLQREYTGPAGAHMVITENGAAYEDVVDEDGFVDDSLTRLPYIRDHLAACHQAIEEGADLRGYLVWSLMDNFEWAFGYTRRFGVVHVDFITQKRTPKASARWYQGVIAAGAIDI